MTMGSLFAGIGGFDLGFTRAGFTVSWQVEIDEWCRGILARHFPNAQRHADIRDTGAHNLEPVDVICGGFPCQPYSTASAGKRKGADDDRALWPEMRRVIDELRPRWVVGENVVGFDGVDLERVVSNLEGSGYEVAPPIVIPACSVGQTHRRDRYWICGYTDSYRKPKCPEHAEASGLQTHADHLPGSMGGDDGLSARLDRQRLRALGNAVVPQIPELIGRMILETERLEALRRAAA